MADSGPATQGKPVISLAEFRRQIGLLTGAADVTANGQRLGTWYPSKRAPAADAPLVWVRIPR